MTEDSKQLVLIILDGWGFREDPEHNAVAAAHTPYYDFLWNNYHHALLEASGKAVGLPEGQMGNSEIGHLVIGAGRPIKTDFERISESALNGEFGDNPAFSNLFNHVKKYDSVLHVKGLIGPGGVHAHSDHLKAFLSAAKNAGISKIAIHAFTDGRDTPPQSANNYLREIEDAIEDAGIGFIASACGRFYAMDRDNNWERLKKAEDAIFEGKADQISSMRASELMSELYKEGLSDEHLKPVIFLDEQGNKYQISNNDGVFFFNFRADRARMLGQRLLEKKEDLNLYVVTMTEYDAKLTHDVAFPPEKIETTLAKVVSQAGLTQVHIAETEKYAHATYFLNGGLEMPHKGEKHILIDSRKDIDTHDKAPEMRASEITREALKYLADGTNLIFINFANADMIGHTANYNAIITALEALDQNLQILTEAAIKNCAKVIITADHGNAEINVDENNQKHTAHTLNPVPMILAYKGKDYEKIKKIQNGTLADITPTALDLLGIEKPPCMTGHSLITMY